MEIRRALFCGWRVDSATEREFIIIGGLVGRKGTDNFWRVSQGV